MSIKKGISPKSDMPYYYINIYHILFGSYSPSVNILLSIYYDDYIIFHFILLRGRISPIYLDIVIFCGIYNTAISSIIYTTALSII